jgi:hypothetical protein
MVLTVSRSDEDEDGACVEVGGGGGGGGGEDDDGTELLTVLDVGCAEDGPGAVPEG